MSYKPSISICDACKLLNIPTEVSVQYEVMGIKNLYEWQSNCLFKSGQSNYLPYEENLVYSAPTSGGKTLVAELYALQSIFKGKKALIVLPYVSMITEKISYYKLLFRQINKILPKSKKIKVRGVYGDNSTYNINRDCFFIATIEKANRIVNDILSSDRIKYSLGCIAVDELHVLGESFNGYLLEILVSKVLFFNSTNLNNQIQVIAMSATVSNVNELANWIKGRLFVTDFRPIPLQELVKAGNIIYDKSGKIVMELPPPTRKDDTDNLAALCSHALNSGQQTLIFTSTKADCFRICKLFCDWSNNSLAGEINIENYSNIISHLKSKNSKLLYERQALCDQILKVSSRSNADILKSSIMNGMCWHMSSLGMVERELIEGGFKSGCLSILVATTTLASGVNLPAGCVIIRSLNVGREKLGVMQYRQMTGRAGRVGQSTTGTSILTVRSHEKENALELVNQPNPRVVSQLYALRDSGNGVLKAIIEVIGLKLCLIIPHLELFMSNTLMHRQKNTSTSIDLPSYSGFNSPSFDLQCSEMRQLVGKSVEFLLSSRIIETKESYYDCSESSNTGNRPTPGSSYLSLTRFGKAVLKCNLNPDEAIIIYESLIAAREGLNLESNLHVLYLVSPLNVASSGYTSGAENYNGLNPNFKILFNHYERSLKTTQKTLASVFDAIGIEKSELMHWSYNPPSKKAMDICFEREKIQNLMENDRSSYQSSCTNNQFQPSYGLMEMVCRQQSLTEIQWKNICFSKRIWLAVILSKLIDGNSHSLEQIAMDFSCSVVDLKSLFQGTVMMASRVQRFATELGWNSLAKLISDFKKTSLDDMKLGFDDFGNTTDMKDLLQLSLVTPRIARIFINNGVKTILELSTRSSDSLMQFLQLSSGFELKNSLLETDLNQIELQSALSDDTAVVYENKVVSNSNAEKPNSKRSRDNNSSYDMNRLQSWLDAIIVSAKEFLESQESKNDEHALILAKSLGRLKLDFPDGESSIPSMNSIIGYIAKQVHVEAEESESDVSSSLEESEIDENEFDIEIDSKWELLVEENISDDETNMFLDDQLDEKPQICSAAKILSDLQNNRELAMSCQIASKEDNKILVPESKDRFSSPPLKILRQSKNDITDDLLSSNVSDCLENLVSNDEKSVKFSDGYIIHARSNQKMSDHVNIENLKVIKQSTPNNNLSNQDLFVLEMNRNMVDTPARYLTPFTPSKIRTPGKYLYYPQLFEDRLNNEFTVMNNVNCLNKSGYNLTRSLSVTIPSNAFGYRNLQVTEHCQNFFSHLFNASCLSFELMYRQIPQYPNLSSRNAVSSTLSTKNKSRWLSVIAWSCPVSSSSKFGGLPSSNKVLIDNSGQRTMMHDPHILSGISFNFGDNYGYYLPLPCPIPLTNPGYSTKSKVERFGKSNLPNITINDLPDKCYEIICQYVWFHSFLSKCPHLRQCYKLSGVVASISGSANADNSPYADMQRTLKHHTDLSQSNPLFLVSRRWSLCCRKALYLEWLKGQCVEWRLVNDIMSSIHITKIALDMKNKLVSLRERDIIVKGPIQDPAVALELLKAYDYNKPTGKSANKAPSNQSTESQVNCTLDECHELLLPQSQTNSTSNEYFYRRCSYRSIAIMRVMSQLDRFLIQKYPTADSLFQRIEMPLLISVADSEYHGMPVNSTYFSNLRQDLQDRKQLIEVYLSQMDLHLGLRKGQFNVDSIQDVGALKKKLLAHISSSTNFNLNGLSDSHRDDSNKLSSTLSTTKISSDMEREAYLLNLLEYHPISLLISEYRSLTRLFPTIISILNNKLEYRVKAVFSPLGTETGRLIVTSPPLQQIPHICKYIPVKRYTIAEEISVMTKRDQNFPMKLIHSLNDNINRGQNDWVRVSQRQSAIGSVNNTTVMFDEATCYDSTPSRLLDKDHDSAMSAFSVGRITAVIQDKAFSGLTNFTTVTDDLKLQVEFGNEGRNGIFSSIDVARLAAPIPSDVNEFNYLQSSISMPWTIPAPSIDTNIHRKYVEVQVRDGFQASHGYVLIAADYSQIELRILAHLCEDKSLCDAFYQNQDVFTGIASSWLQKPSSSVSPSERTMVKQICYGLIYGMGTDMIAKKSNVSQEQAIRMYNEFLAKYPGIKVFIESVKKSCKMLGYVETILGRRRVINNIDCCDDRKKRLRAERQAVNTVCQGSAADLIKLAMINIHYRLEILSKRKRTFRQSCRAPGGGLYHRLDDYRLILQVHDELVYEVKQKDVIEISEIIRECMENATELRVPLKVDIEIGRKWGSLTSFEEFKSQHRINSEEHTSVKSIEREIFKNFEDF